MEEINPHHLNHLINGFVWERWRPDYPWHIVDIWSLLRRAVKIAILGPRGGVVSGL